MRKAVLLITALVFIILLMVYYPTYIEKPILNGSGPLAVHIDPLFPAPQTHNPLEWWQTHHMDVVNRGDLDQTDCLYCHDQQISCNNCHGYVGVAPIVTTNP